MEEEDKKLPLGGMAWQDLSYHADTSIKEGIFTIKELAEKIKRKATIVHTTRSGIHYYEIDDNEIDSIIKEMEQKNK